MGITQRERPLLTLVGFGGAKPEIRKREEGETEAGRGKRGNRKEMERGGEGEKEKKLKFQEAKKGKRGANQIKG